MRVEHRWCDRCETVIFKADGTMTVSLFGPSRTLDLCQNCQADFEIWATTKISRT